MEDDTMEASEASPLPIPSSSSSSQWDGFQLFFKGDQLQKLKDRKYEECLKGFKKLEDFASKSQWYRVKISCMLQGSTLKNLQLSAAKKIVDTLVTREQQKSEMKEKEYKRLRLISDSITDLIALLEFGQSDFTGRNWLSGLSWYRRSYETLQDKGFKPFDMDLLKEDVLAQLIKCALELKDMETAFKYANEILNFCPGSAVALELRGRIWMRIELFKEAISDFMSAAEVAQHTSRYLALIALAKESEKKADEEEKELEDSLIESDLRTTHYMILGVARNASLYHITKAYKEMTRKFHPDKNLGKSKAELDQNKQELVKIQESYEVLKSVKSRRQYDARLANAKTTRAFFRQSKEERMQSKLTDLKAKYPGIFLESRVDPSTQRKESSKFGPRSTANAQTPSSSSSTSEGSATSSNPPKPAAGNEAQALSNSEERNVGDTSKKEQPVKVQKASSSSVSQNSESISTGQSSSFFPSAQKPDTSNSQEVSSTSGHRSRRPRSFTTQPAQKNQSQQTQRSRSVERSSVEQGKRKRRSNIPEVPTHPMCLRKRRQV